jgi:ABC-type uncharacterized transport system substrate-binding protein
VGLVFVLPDPLFVTERRRVAALAIEAHLPTVYAFREHVQEGGLLSYGIDVSEAFRRVASFVDKILKGAKPGDLPIELPTKLELVINLKTAKALGTTEREFRDLHHSINHRFERVSGRLETIEARIEVFSRRVDDEAEQRHKLAERLSNVERSV